MINELKNILNSQDWYYSYSDDNRAYKRGQEKRSKLNRTIAKIAGSSDSEKTEAMELINSIAPDDFKEALIEGLEIKTSKVEKPEETEMSNVKFASIEDSELKEIIQTEVPRRTSIVRKKKPSSE